MRLRMPLVVPHVLLTMTTILAVEGRATGVFAELPLPDISHTNWQLGPYIKGSTDHVRDLINGPLEGLLAKRADLVRQQAALRTADAAKAKAVADRLRQTSPTFAKAEADLAAARSALEAARRGDDAAARIAAQEQVRIAGADVGRQLQAATGTDSDLAADRQAVADLQQRIAALEAPIASAAKGRVRTLDAFRTSAALPGPPTEGAKGMLKQVKPVKILDAHTFVAEYLAIEKVKEVKDANVADGVKAYQGRGYRVRLLVTDTDTAKLRERKAVDLDRTYQLAGTQKVGNVTCLVAKPVPDQRLDALFAVLDDVRTPPPPPAVDTAAAAVDR